MMQSSLARKLRVLRAERGLTQRAASAQIGVTKETLSDLERGLRHPHDVTLSRIARGYGVPVEELLEEPQVSLAGKAEAPEAGGPDQRTEEEAAGKLAFDSLVAEEHRAAMVRALRGYMRRRADEYARQLEDQENLHFRSASAANLWLENLYGEMRDWGVWAYANRKVLLPDFGEDTAEDFVHAVFDMFIWPIFAFKSIARKAEQRIEKMTDVPDALAERRMRTAKEEAEAAERQLVAEREQAV
jgi:transcriptional regulator with XRE-family HTH domain